MGIARQYIDTKRRLLLGILLLNSFHLIVEQRVSTGPLAIVRIVLQIRWAYLVRLRNDHRSIPLVLQPNFRPSPCPSVFRFQIAVRSFRIDGLPFLSLFPLNVLLDSIRRTVKIIVPFPRKTTAYANHAIGETRGFVRRWMVLKTFPQIRRGTTSGTALAPHDVFFVFVDRTI